MAQKAAKKEEETQLFQLSFAQTMLTKSRMSLSEEEQKYGRPALPWRTSPKNLDVWLLQGVHRPSLSDWVRGNARVTRWTIRRVMCGSD